MTTLKEDILELYSEWSDVEEAKLVLSNAEQKLNNRLDRIGKEIDRLNLLKGEDKGTILIHQLKGYHNHLLLLRVDPPKYKDYPHCWIVEVPLLNPDVTTDIEGDDDSTSHTNYDSDD